MIPIDRLMGRSPHEPDVIDPPDPSAQCLSDWNLAAIAAPFHSFVQRLI
jgi:hypothetical protein